MVSCDGLCSSCFPKLGHCEECGADVFTGVVSYLHEKTCLKDCPSGYYGNQQYRCQPCEFPCTECTIAPTLCTRCEQKPLFDKPFASLVSLSCFEECPDGTYTSIESMQCVGCEDPCYTCLDQDTCLSCDVQGNNKQVYYFKNQCFEQCPPVSVPSPSKVCVECESPCVHCSELPERCTLCEGDLFVYRGSCVEECPFGYFKDSDTRWC